MTPVSLYNLSPIWRGILQCVDIMFVSARTRLGDGQRCLFRMDRWCEDLTLEERFPQLFAIASSSTASVSQVFEPQLSEGTRTPSFRRNLWVEKIDQLLELLSLLEFASTVNCDDRWQWR